MSLKPETRQARRENVSNRAAARQLIDTVREMNDAELEQLRAAINGEPVLVNANPRRALAFAREDELFKAQAEEEALDPMGTK